TWRSPLERFTDVVGELAGRGHEVVVASPAQKPRTLPEGLRDTPGVELVSYDEVSDESRAGALALLRRTRDYVWYLSPKQPVASFNRRRSLDWLAWTASGQAHGANPAWPDPLLTLEPEDQTTVDDALGQIDARIP